MRQPDMAHTPAYYQDQHHIVTAYLSDPQNQLTTPSAAHLPAETSAASSQQGNYDQRRTTKSGPSSDYSSVKASTKYPPSDLRGFTSSSLSHSNNRYTKQQQSRNSSLEEQNRVLAEPVYSSFEQPAAVAPVTFVSSPYLEDGSILTWASYSNGAVPKEERIRGSWTDHSSYMSGENHTPSAARVPKRAGQDEELPVGANQDALLMLFRMSFPIPIFSLFASLYTIFGLLFVILIAPFRLCSCLSYLRNTSFRTQLCDLLIPQLHLHERLIGLRESSNRSSSTQTIYTDPDRSSATNRYDGYSVGGLLSVLLLSSLFSFGFLLLAWTAAFFWIFAMILGNPDGTERKDDGRAAVLGVIRWWQLWLSKARKPPR